MIVTMEPETEHPDAPPVGGPCWDAKHTGVVYVWASVMVQVVAEAMVQVPAIVFAAN